MGVETKKKSSERPLPVPSATESSIMGPTQSELGTDDKSSYSLPEDGTPVTIKTHNRGKSQTSLLIEYFEGGKGAPSGDGRKPSVRVRLTPSHKSNRKSSGSDRGRIEITEAKSTRRSSQSRRADRHSQNALTRSENELMSVLSGGDEDNNSYASATEESNVSRNIEIEIGERSERSANRRARRPASPLIPSADSKNSSYNAGNMSDISAIPSDSFLDEPYVSHKNSDVKSPGSRSRSPLRGGDALAGAAAGITAAAVTDKLRTKSRDESRNREYERGEREKVSVTKTRGDKEKSGSSNRLHKSTKSRTSSLSKEERSSKRSESRSKHNDSLVSGAESSMLSTAAASQRSMGAESMRSGQSKASSINNPKLLETVEDAIRRLILPELNALKREQSLRQDRKAASATSSATTASRDEGSDRRRTSRADRNSGATPTPKEPIKIEKRDREARNAFDESPAGSALSQDTRSDVHDIDHSPAASTDRLKTAAAGAAMGAAAAAAHDSLKSPGENRSRRRRRELRNRAGNEHEDYDDDASDFLAPAPPMPLMSELNPSDVTRASILSADTDRPHSASEEIAPKQDQNGQYHTEDSTPTPTRTPITLLSLGTQHANISHGDLKQLPRQRGTENQDNDYHTGAPSVESYDDLDDYDDHEREYGHSPYDYYNTQEVPPPLKYVPYQPEKRGLSPIPSVSGYTEGSEAPNRDSRAFGGSVSNGSRTPGNMSVASLRTPGMDQSNVSGMTNSEVDGNGHAVRAVGAIPNYVHTSGVDSNHASLVEGSMVDSLRSSGINQQPYRNSMATNGSQEGDRPDTAGNDSQASYDYQEYDLDEYGRKVPRQRHYTTASEAAITSAAVGAAAAALRQQGKQENQGTSEWQGEGVQRNKSFKERAQNGSGPALEPKHSIDRMSDVSVPIKLGFSGLPDIGDPLPDFEYWNEDDLITNPSMLNGEEGGWEGDATPKQRPQSSVDDFNYRPLDGTHDALQKGLNLNGNQQSGQEQDEWYRTEEDRKRDTLVTNPYEDASPIANLAGLGDSLLSPGGYDNYGNATRSPVGQKVDEGYISQGPNKTPDTSMDKGKDIDYGTPLNLGGAKNQNPMDFFGSGSRQVSGMSDGMDSQMYDPATGTGIDKIESKDIMALMQHLMVRDAQRSARDTEILVTLVRAATEMRNNFEDLKRLLADTEDVIITEVKENTEKTVQRAINGPRPFPGSAPRSLHSNSQAATTTTMDEMSNKKQKNIFRRALMKGLGHKGPNDLGRIEDMLMQLLTQVDDLKSQTVPGAGSVPMSHQDERSYENMQSQGQYEQDRGYEPEGHAGTSTNSASQSGQLSIQSRGTPGQQNYVRKVSGHRISTVPEDDEDDEYDNESIRFGGPEVLMTPAHAQRSGSLQATPRGSPPNASGALQMSPGYDNTRRSPAYDNCRSPAYENARSPDYQQQYENTRSPDYQNAAKQNEDQKKKGRSSWFKSRWSESTTTTNITQLFRRSGQSRKDEEDEQQWSPRPADQPTMPTYRNNTVSSRADSIGTSTYSDNFQFSNPHPKPKNDPYSQGPELSHDLHEDPESPVLAYNSMQPPQPNWVAMTPEEAKYKAHRNSLNLVHPQPRQGQTERFKQALESQALGFTGGNSPMLSPKSEDWAGSATSLNRLPRNLNRDSFESQSNEANPNWQQIYSSSPAPAALSITSGGPPRPPKEPIDGTTGSGPNSPSQTRKLENKNLSGATGQVSRRPSGPRPMTPSNDREGRGSGGILSEGSRRTGSLLRD